MGPYSETSDCRPIAHFNPANIDDTVRPGDIVTLRSLGSSARGDLVVFEVKRLEVETTTEREYVYGTKRAYNTVYVVSRLGARHRIGDGSWELVSVEHPPKPFPTEAEAVISWKLAGSNFGDSAQRLGTTDGWFMAGDARKYTTAELRDLVGKAEWKALS